VIRTVGRDVKEFEVEGVLNQELAAIEWKRFCDND